MAVALRKVLRYI